MVMVAVYHIWLDCMHAGYFSVPAYQAILVKFVNLSSRETFLLLDHKVTLKTAAHTRPAVKNLLSIHQLLDTIHI